MISFLSDATSYIIISSGFRISGLRFDPRDHSLPFPSISSQEFIYSFAVQETLQRIYWLTSNNLQYTSVHGGPSVVVKDISSLGM